MRDRLVPIAASLLFAALALGFAGAAPAAAVVLEDGLGGPPAADLELPVTSEIVHYFVVLEGDPVATYRGGIPGLEGTAAELHGDVHLDFETPAALAYRDYLAREREAAIAAVRYAAPEMELGWEWELVLNGFSAEMTPESAVRVAELPGVRIVHPAEELEEELDSTPALLHLAEAWEASGGAAEAGLGARIGTLEGGMVDHPMFSDEGFPEPPEGFPNAKKIGRNGEAQYEDYTPYANDKLIGARVIVREATEESLQNTQTPALCSATGCSSHGAHVMGIATGRQGEYEVPVGPGTETLEMTGMAPMAHFFVYQNYDSTPGMVTGIEYMVKDEIDVWNASLGQSGWLIDAPQTHPITLAIEAAADAGTLGVVSAGNSGANGPTALSGSWKYSERLLAVGSTSSPGLTARRATFEGEGVPEGSADQPVGDRGQPISDELSGETFFADDGCTIDEAAAGKIAIVKRFNADGSWHGACGYTDRAANMDASGAIAIIYYYEDRAFGGDSGTALALPSVAWGAAYGGAELWDWFVNGGSGTVTIGATVQRSYDNIPDLLAGSSSQGYGLDWTIKPDISAPGDGILSAVGSGAEDARVYGIASLGGTSMAAPHVTGMAALLRSAHPDWTSDQVRSTLINYSVPTVLWDPIALDPATPGQAGPGRVDMEWAMDPGLFLDPPKASFGAIPPGEEQSIEVSVENAGEQEESWTLELAPAVGNADVSLDTESLTVAAGETASFTVSLTGMEEDEGQDNWGHVILTRGDTEQKMYVTYFAYVDRPADRRDVMVINWTYGRTPDHVDAYTEALEAAGLTYSVYRMGDPDDHPDVQDAHPTYREMYQHDMVIVNANESQYSFQSRLTGQFQYQNYMLGGGSLLITGQGSPNFWRWINWDTAYGENNKPALPDTWPYAWNSNSQNGGCEMCWGRYFAGFTPHITSTLAGRHLVPFPQSPPTGTHEVILPPHEDADGPFTYSLDISTGDSAPEGAAGNQYSFASGAVADEYIPSTSAQETSGLADLSYAEGIVSSIGELARPLWSYTGDFQNAEGEMEEMTKVVGTYVAGQQHPESAIAWNAMIWGFGLEGVGESGEDTVSRETLLGDTFNFLAHNLYDVGVEKTADTAEGSTVRLALPDFASDPMIASVEMDWGDGSGLEQVDVEPPVAASELELTHEYAETGTYEIRFHVTPAAHAAPFVASGEIEVEAASTPVIYLPLVMRDHELPGEALAAVGPRASRPVELR